MSGQLSRSVLCLAIAFAMAFGSLLPHATYLPSRDQLFLATERLAQFEDEIAEHGHSHDEVTDREQGHTHGHNPADHSHETPTAPPGDGPALQTLLPAWITVAPQAAHIGASYRLERPPKLIVLA